MVAVLDSGYSSAMTTSTGVALIGTGYWGPGIARNLDAMSCVDLLHLVDRQPERAREVADRLGSDAETHDDVSRALADPRVAAVVIATPVRSHFELAVASLQAGKHTLVEKPLSMTIAHCRQLEDIARQRDLVLMVGHIFRFNAAVTKVKNYIDSGELGDVLYVHSRRVNLGRVQADINALLRHTTSRSSVTGSRPSPSRSRREASATSRTVSKTSCSAPFATHATSARTCTWAGSTRARSAR